MPFAGYEDFDDCVAKNKDKDDPKGYCAEIQRRSEKRYKLVFLDIPQPTWAADVPAEKRKRLDYSLTFTLPADVDIMGYLRELTEGRDLGRYIVEALDD